MNEILENIKQFYRDYVRLIDRFILYSLLLFTILGCCLMLINARGTHYTGWQYIHSMALLIIISMALFWIAGLYIYDIVPRIATVIRTIGIGVLLSTASLWLASGIQYTPFPAIDKFLLTMDYRMGIHLRTLMQWTCTHQYIKEIFNFAYNSIAYQLVAIPILAALFLERNAINIYFVSVVISFLIGTMLYYFFPTAAPVSIVSSQFFQFEQHETYLKFFEIHHQLPVTTGEGGMISFPSFHVIWITLVTYLTLSKKWLFYPLVLFNIVTIASTVFLGWHYFADVLSGLALSAIGIWLAHWIYRRYNLGES